MRGRAQSRIVAKIRKGGGVASIRRNKEKYVNATESEHAQQRVNVRMSVRSLTQKSTCISTGMNRYELLRRIHTLTVRKSLRVLSR